MKLLVLGLVPVIVFWLVEDHYGTLWGIVAAVVWAIGECAYEFIHKKKVDRLTLFSTALTVGLGGLAAWLNRGVLFKFQPVIIEGVFAGILIWGGRGGEPLLLKMAKQSRPDVFMPPPSSDPEGRLLQDCMGAHQLKIMIKLTRHLIALILIHCVILSYVAIKGTTGQWAFWKGVGFNVFILIWAAAEVAIMKFGSKSVILKKIQKP